MKKCSACKQQLSLDKFHKDRTKHDGVRAYCKQCMIIKNTTTIMADQQRDSYLRRTYGITYETVLNLLEAQQDRCLICLKEFRYSSKNDWPFIDHCHATNKIRGLLCGWCNLGIGYLKDNASICRSASRYLNAF